MDYEQKYNKLVEAIKVLQETNPSDEGIQNWVNDNVPELAESEDERIRKYLIYCVNRTISESDDFNEISKEQILAWLEKQGSEPNWCHHKVDLSNCSEEYRKAYYDGWNNCNIQHSQCAWSKEDEKVYQSIIDDTVQENQLDNEQINWFISLKKRIRG